MHEVHLDSDMAKVADGSALRDTVPVTAYDISALGLELGQKYYWKINEVNEVETPAIWQGAVWDFTTQEYFVVDDFESYNDLDPTDPDSNRIFNTWIDGYEVPTNGSLVGYENPPFCERTIVHGGSQSMPFFYDNTGTTAYSEGERTFAVPQDWTRAGIQTLVLHFYEDPNNTGGKLYVKVNGERVDYTEDPGAVRPPEWASWRQWNIDLASLGIDLANVTTLTIGVDGVSATGLFYIDDILLYKSAPPAPKVLTWFEAESGTITAPMMVYVGDPTASDGHYIGTDEDLGDETTNPPVDGIATYDFTVPGGTYKVVLRIVAANGSDTFWVRIPTATTNTSNHSSGWVLFGQPQHSDHWQWLRWPAVGYGAGSQQSQRSQCSGRNR
jgi:hypothetical protein